MSKYVLDLQNKDDAEVLNLTNHDNTATIETNLTTATVDVTNLTKLVSEPIDRQIFVEEHGDTTGYNILGRTVYNSDYSASALLGLPYNDLIAHLVREVIYGNTFEDVWTQWNRISHLESTQNQPAKASELNSWAYDEVADSVSCTINSTSFIGFVSNYKISTDFVFDTIVGSVDTDNDAVVVILGFVVGDDGREHTLCAVRSASTEGHLKVTGKFDIWYNYKQSNAKLIASGGGTAGVSGGWGSKYSRVTATKTGNKFVVTCTEFSQGKEVADHDATTVEVSHRFDLGDHAELGKFIAGAGFGYGSVSQNKSTFINVLRPDQKKASAFKDVVEYTNGLSEQKYYRIAYLDQVTEEGEVTDGYVVDDTPSRSHAVTLVNKAYTPDTVDVSYDKVNTLDVMEMTEALNDFDWYRPAEEDGMASAPQAVVHATAGATKWDQFDWIAPTADYGEAGAKLFFRKDVFLEAGVHTFRAFADDVLHVWVNDTKLDIAQFTDTDIELARGWHTITILAVDAGAGLTYAGLTASRDGNLIVKTDTSWKCLIADDVNKYDVHNLPNIGVYPERHKDEAIEAFATAATRAGISVGKMMSNIDVEFVNELDGSLPVSYLQVNFDSLVLNDGANAKFRLPKYFSEFVTVTKLKGFMYSPIAAGAVVE